MGHGSMRAALIYRHATNARDRSIADAMSALVESGRTEAPGEQRQRCGPGRRGRRRRFGRGDGPGGLMAR